jgi:hypothetical protein
MPNDPSLRANKAIAGELRKLGAGDGGSPSEVPYLLAVAEHHRGNGLTTRDGFPGRELAEVVTGLTSVAHPCKCRSSRRARGQGILAPAAFTPIRTKVVTRDECLTAGRN